MKKIIKKTVSLILIICTAFTVLSIPASALAPPAGLDYLNTYVNTGNQKEDILGVARTQLGYTEIVGNDTKYGNWYGYPGCAWCAMFVTWCARQADIPTDVLSRAHNARPEKYGLDKYYKGTEYTPQPGDLFFTPELDHVGLVYYVEGEYFYTLEGNTINHELETYEVMSKKRLIEEFCFGVPDYEGTEPDHNYVKKQETAHPHEVYYECTKCGEKNYTGYYECIISCSECITCNCSTSYAGYYKFTDTDYGWQRIRTNHSSYGSSVGCVSNGEIVYVYAADPSNNLAYINYDGIIGHAPYNQLTKYKAPPDSAKLSCDKTDYVAGDSVVLSWNIPSDTEQVRVSLYRNGEEVIHEKKVGLNTGYAFTDIDEGSYKAEVVTCNLAGSSVSSIEFSVRNIYYLNYDAGSGAGAPETATQVIGEKITVAEGTPSRENYTFLGWTDEEGGSTAKYYAGDEILSYRDMTLYAVWMENTAVPVSLSVYTEPSQKYYLIDEALDPDGLSVLLCYSDGSSAIIYEGFELSGFESAEIGVKTVTVTYKELSTSFNVEVMEYIPGDIDLNKSVNRDDVMALLWHITFPEEFPVTVPSDFTGDNFVNRDDVMALLWHITFPEEFPLTLN